jgi:hypothetical protein
MAAVVATGAGRRMMGDAPDVPNDWRQMTEAEWRGLPLRTLERRALVMRRAGRAEQGLMAFSLDDYREEIERRRSARQATALTVLTVLIAVLTIALLADALGYLPCTGPYCG